MKVTFNRVRDEPTGRALERREAPLTLTRSTAAGAATDDGLRGCFVLHGPMARRENEGVRTGDCENGDSRETGKRGNGGFVALIPKASVFIVGPDLSYPPTPKRPNRLRP
jgi:hypothetical protein